MQRELVQGELEVKTIACVMKSGGWKNRNHRVEYGPSHVRWLRDQFTRQVTLPFRFVCLSDVQIAGVDVIPLQDDLPGWWSKMELFRALDEAFYVDLDTVITGNIDPMLAYAHRFTALKALSAANGNRLGSGVLAWGRDMSGLYREFMADAPRHMRECNTPANWGDQGFIEHHTTGVEYFQDLFPGKIKSYKIDFLRGKPIAGASIVCFHGQPKPWEVKHDWVPRHG